MKICKMKEVKNDFENKKFQHKNFIKDTNIVVENNENFS